MVFGFFKREAGTKLLVGTILRQDPGSLFQFASGSDLDQLAGHHLDAFFELGLAGLPAGAPQPIKLHHRIVRPIARQQFDILNRQEELVAAMINNLQAIVGSPRHLNGLQPIKTTDPVVHMHNHISGAEARRFCEEIVGTLFTVTMNKPVAQHILLADDCQLIGLKARLQPKHQQMHHRRVGGHDTCPVICQNTAFGPVILQNTLQAFSCPNTPTGNDNAFS